MTARPTPLLRADDETRAREIEMTRQEVAVALSHIQVWKLISDGYVPSALVLEDDIFMTCGFARDLKATWSSLAGSASGGPSFDLLYLAFNEVGNVAPVRNGAGARRLRAPGIWEASGYVLSREGARKLLDQLPVCGPVDLWLNMQFGRLSAFTAARPLIEQRIDEPSTNSYSVLPVLSQVGVITREKPLLPAARRLSGPVVGVGSPGSGLTALGMALSMLGYTCCSDLDRLPPDEERALLRGGRGRLFNAYVNIGSLSPEALAHVVRANPGARVVATSADQPLPADVGDHALRLTPEVKDRWAVLSEFLGIDYPAFPYPVPLEYSIEWRPALSPAGLTWCWLACRVLLKIVYLLTCRVLSLVVLVFRGDRAKDAELLVLRHENAVLRRHAGCGISRPTGPGSPRWRGLYRAGAGPKSFP